VPGIQPEDRRAACAGADKIEQGADRRGFARAVRPQEPVNFAAIDLQVHVLDRGEFAIAVGQVRRLDHGL